MGSAGAPKRYIHALIPGTCDTGSLSPLGHLQVVASTLGRDKRHRHTEEKVM